MTAIFIAPFCSLHSEKNKDSRFVLLAQEYSKVSGSTCYLLTSNFSHTLKSRRKQLYLQYPRIDILLCSEPGYKSNVSFLRFFSNIILQVNIMVTLLLLVARKRKSLQFIYCAYPFEFLAFISSLIGLIFRIKVFVDIQDLWPIALMTPIKSDFIRLLIKPFFFPLWILGQLSFFLSYKVVAVSDRYLRYAKLTRRPGVILYLGSDLIPLADSSKSDSTFHIVYSGTISASYAVEQVCKFTNYVNSFCGFSRHIILTFAGDGPDKKSLQKKFESKSIRFVGRLTQDQLRLLYSNANCFLNPPSKFAYQDINNRLCDYMLQQKPILTSRHILDLDFICPKLIHYYDDQESFNSALQDLLVNHNLPKFADSSESIIRIIYRKVSYPEFVKNELLK